jgi:hypothetical protein
MNRKTMYSVFAKNDCGNGKWFGSRVKNKWGGWVETDNFPQALRQFKRTCGKLSQIEISKFVRSRRTKREVIFWHKNLLPKVSIGKLSKFKG